MERAASFSCDIRLVRSRLNCELDPSVLSAEASVVVAVSAPHRQDALAACREAIDTLKETVPLWKKEVYEGGEEWIGRGS